MEPKAPNPQYDDIVRRTVPNPDGSFRPSREQVEDAYKDPADRPEMVMAGDERALRDRVQAAFTDDPSLVVERIRIDIEGTRVILSGSVAGPPLVQRAEELAKATVGVSAVENHLSPVPSIPHP